jgi:hypothetical protein
MNPGLQRNALGIFNKIVSANIARSQSIFIATIVREVFHYDDSEREQRSRRMGLWVGPKATRLVEPRRFSRRYMLHFFLLLVG